MATSSIYTAPPIMRAHRLARLFVVWVVVLTAAAFAIALNQGASSTTLAAILALALITIIALWVYQIVRSPSPTKLIPIGLPRSFTRRLTDTSIIIGRTPCSDISLPLATVSGHHCRIFKLGRRWFVEDLASSNGTFVNDCRIQRKRIRIGDKIAVGEFEFMVG